jgi:SynChlorMet cassette protein ScmC
MKKQSRPGFTLSLADGARWLIRPGDPEAARVVTALGAAMQLQPAHSTLTGSPPQQVGERTRELLVTAQLGRVVPPTNLHGPGPVVCTLPEPATDAMFTIGMTHVGLAIARAAQSRGGMLLHGALAEHDNPSGLTQGIILAGPGTVGKTTASNRLPPPWRPLCDDTTLIVRDSQARYWAHPWPTWSRFYAYNGDPPPGGSWNVQHAVPLHALFFLSQSPDDRIEPIHVPQATAMLMEAVQHVSSTMTRCLNPEQVHALHREQLAAAETLARAVPTHILHISLTGAFWEEIEQVLQYDAIHPTRHASRATHHISRLTQPAATESLPNDTTLLVTYSGPSMNPTLREPDLLEVAPYDGRQVRVGDVIYFEPPEEERKIVHRVIRVKPDGIYTRGDNNPTDDSYRLQTTDIIGQVVIAQRGPKKRRIAGGRSGALFGYAARLWRVINRGASGLLHGTYHILARSRLFRGLLPLRLRPRLLVFQSKKEQTFKLVMGQREVGRYDNRRRQWTIQRPFRLFVDETHLPAIPPLPQKSHRTATTDEHLV